MSEYALEPGTQLHEYRIDRLLGQGGFGITYQATNVNIDTLVAIKEYFPSDYAGRDETGRVFDRKPEHPVFQWGKDKFLDEARNLAKFKHPNIVRVVTSFTALGTAYLVMEYLEGDTLQQYIEKAQAQEKGPFPEAELATIVNALLDALQYMHERNYIHRDIKPDNVLMHREFDKGGSYKPVLIDLGSARQYFDEKEQQVRKATRLQGTVGYAPIEQFNKRFSQGPWTDIYALGATLYYVLTGEDPLDATDRYFGLTHEDRDSLIPVSVKAKGRYSEPLLSAIDESLEVLPNDRPADIAAFREYMAGEKPGLKLRKLWQELHEIETLYTKGIDEDDERKKTKTLTGAKKRITKFEKGMGPVSKTLREQVDALKTKIDHSLPTIIEPPAWSRRRIVWGLGLLVLVGSSVPLYLLIDWEEKIRKFEEWQRQRAAEARRKAEEEAKRKAEEERLAAEARRQAEEEAKRKAEEERLAAEARRQAEEEEKRKADEERLAAEVRRKAEEEVKRKADEERLAAEARRQAEEEVKRKADEERFAAEVRRQAEEERERRAAEARRQAEEEAKRKTDEERRAAEARRQVEAKRRAEEKAKRRTDEERRATEAKRKTEEEWLRAEAKRQADEERKRRAAEAKHRADEEVKRKAEKKRRAAEAKRKADEERERLAAEARRQAEEERERRAAEARRQAEEERERRAAEARRQAEEERERLAAEARRQAEEEEKRKADEEAKNPDIHFGF